MKPPVSIFEKTKTFIADNFAKDLGKTLLVTGTLGWIFSACGQIFGIATNKKVSNEKKKFLIPQEIADACINIASFYIVTNSIQLATKKLASSGKFITPKTKEICEKYGIKYIKEKGGEKINIGKSVLNKIDNLRNALKTNEIEKISVTKQKAAEINKKITVLNDFYDKDYAPFESGFKVAGNIVGAIVSTNIITPMLRNPIAAQKQKQSIAQERYEQMEKMNTLSDSAITPPNKPSIDNYKSTTMNMPKGSLKI